MNPMAFQCFKEQYLAGLFYFPVYECTLQMLVAHYHRLGANEKFADVKDKERGQIVAEIKRRGLNPDDVLEKAVDDERTENSRAVKRCSE